MGRDSCRRDGQAHPGLNHYLDERFLVSKYSTVGYSRLDIDALRTGGDNFFKQLPKKATPAN
jgi:hypothetical protein